MRGEGMRRRAVASVTRVRPESWQTGFVVRTNRVAVWVTCVMALAGAGCGSSPSRNTDAAHDANPTAADHSGWDFGSDRTGPDASTPCFVPTDCTAGQACCLTFDNAGGGTVSCQPSSLCVGDGVTTFVVCATDADCPATVRTCTLLTTLPDGRPFNICEVP